MSWIVIAISFAIGGGTGAGITWKAMDTKIKNMKPIIVKEEVASKQQDIIINLTNPQLVKDICELGETLLCRELLCLQFTRGMDSQTGGSQCEQISNFNTSLQMLDRCEKSADFQKCLDVFHRRK